MEIEARFINLEREDIEKKLIELGAEKKFESLFREWLFFIKVILIGMIIIAESECAPMAKPPGSPTRQMQRGL